MQDHGVDGAQAVEVYFFQKHGQAKRDIFGGHDISVKE